MTTAFELIRQTKEKESNVVNSRNFNVRNQRRREILNILEAIKESNPKCLSESNSNAESMRNQLDDLIWMYKSSISPYQGYNKF